MKKKQLKVYKRLNQNNSFSADNFLAQSLKRREEQNALRNLTYPNNLIDFCSNDYLGFAKSEELGNKISEEYNAYLFKRNGSTGSRLLAGNTDYVEQLEKIISGFHQAKAGLIYNSGYDANLGLFSALLQKEDTIIYDELIHASIHDGIKLSSATKYPFKHNDILHLEERLKISKGVIYVAIESIYSMDGDAAIIKEIANLCRKHNANLIVDEAHATGVTSNVGKGLVQLFNLEQEVFARVHTFGKGLGCHGAIVLGSTLLRDYLINFSRSFIYTTALPVKSLIAIHQSYLLLKMRGKDIIHLHQLIDYFKTELLKNKNIRLINSNSSIQSIIISGNNEVKYLAKAIQEKGFDVRPILSPTVPKGKERLRICIHTFNTKGEIKTLVETIGMLI